MYCVEVEEYHRSAGDSIGYRETFATKEEAMDYVEYLKDYNCGVWLTRYDVDENGDWIEDSTICLQEIDFDC